MLGIPVVELDRLLILILLFWQYRKGRK
jgi:hypothetical protein